MQAISSGTFQDFHICLQKIAGSDEVQQGTSTVRVFSAAATGDPIAYMGKDTKVMFWLPLGMFMPLLRTSDLDIWGTTQSGLAGEKGQFFDRIVVTSRGGLSVDVKVSDSSALLADFKNTLPSTEVALLPAASVTDLQMLDVDYIEGAARGAAGLDDGWMQVQGLKRQGASRELPHEAIEVLSNSAHFTICLSYTVDKAADQDLVLTDYSHLALQMIRMPESQNYTGVFPELWGLQAPSNCTLSMMQMEGGFEDLPPECFNFEVYDQQRGRRKVKAIPPPSTCPQGSETCPSARPS
jgi:hypothetical protein